MPNPGDKYDDDFDSREDSQIWFDLYFDDYGDVIFDLNNNGIACDELRSNAISTTTSTHSINSIQQHLLQLQL